MNVGTYLSSFIISPSFTSQIATVSTWSTKSFILPRPGANRIFLMKPLLVVMFFEVFVLTSHKLRFPSESARTIWSLFHAMHVMVAEMNKYRDHKTTFGLSNLDDLGKNLLHRLASAGIFVPSLIALPSTEKWYNWPSGSVNTKCSLATNARASAESVKEIYFIEENWMPKWV